MGLRERRYRPKYKDAHLQAISDLAYELTGDGRLGRVFGSAEGSASLAITQAERHEAARLIARAIESEGTGHAS